MFAGLGSLAGSVPSPLTALGLVVALAGFEIEYRLRSWLGISLDGLWVHAVKFGPPAVVLAIAAAQGLSPAALGWRVDGPVGFLGRVALGLGVMLGANVVVQPVLERLGDAGGTEEMMDEAAGLADTLHGKAVVAATAGVTEETVYNGYALERLAALTGSPVFAGAVTASAFTLGHLGETWSKRAVVRIAQPAVVATALYVWWRSLPVLVAVHALNDFVGLVLSERLVAADDGAEGTAGS